MHAWLEKGHWRRGVPPPCHQEPRGIHQAVAGAGRQRDRPGEGPPTSHGGRWGGQQDHRAGRRARAGLGARGRRAHSTRDGHKAHGKGGLANPGHSTAGPRGLSHGGSLRRGGLRGEACGKAIVVDDGVAQLPCLKDRVAKLEGLRVGQSARATTTVEPVENTKLQEDDAPDSAQLELVFVKSGSDRRGRVRVAGGRLRGKAATSPCTPLLDRDTVCRGELRRVGMGPRCAPPPRYGGVPRNDGVQEVQEGRARGMARWG